MNHQTPRRQETGDRRQETGLRFQVSGFRCQEKQAENLNLNTQTSFVSNLQSTSFPLSSDLCLLPAASYWLSFPMLHAFPTIRHLLILI